MSTLDALLSLPLPPHAILPSTLAVPTLESIPQSNVPSPHFRESPDMRDPAIDLSALTDRLHVTEPSEGGPSIADSRRSSLASYLPIPGSYFPLSNSSFHESSGMSTPSERPRVVIPASTLDEPLFSNYPDQKPRTSSSPKGKGRMLPFGLKSGFVFGSPSRRRGSLLQDSDDDNVAGTGQSSASITPPQERQTGRRRAVTLSHPPQFTPITPERRAESPSPISPASPVIAERRGSLRSNKLLTPSKTFKAFRRRRNSIAGRPFGREAEYVAPDQPHWPSMASEEERRLNPPNRLPFSYQQPDMSDQTLQSISTAGTVRPLTSLPIRDRTSSLGGMSIEGLGPEDQATLEAAAARGATIEVVFATDSNMPHNPPPRRSSLDYGSSSSGIVEISIKPGSPTPDSLMSTSYTSASAFSGSSRDHPLSSATTSLSRSAKSGMEGPDAEIANLTALRLQRSVEWEARQTRHRRRLEKRRMILLEMVETEVGYALDLRKLVQVYLPQLAALPGISEKTSEMIGRNAKDLLVLHEGMMVNMVDVLRDEGVRTLEEMWDEGRAERTARRLAALFVDDAGSMSIYNDYCAGSIAAATLVRQVAQRADYDAFERRCQVISTHQSQPTLASMLIDEEEEMKMEATPTNRSRLHFRDFLIMPIQRICRYPLLLHSLLISSASTPPERAYERPILSGSEKDLTSSSGSPSGSATGSRRPSTDFDVGVDVERALGAMRSVAEEADEARRLQEAEIKSATVLERLELHTVLTPTFLRSLGTCRLIGSLDVLHHHPVVAPLIAPAKVKYLAAFLYRGYLILAKVKRGKVYEAKHFLPLEVFELIDVAEGFLPHSIRLTLREHNFDLAASCEAEKDVWAAALCEARDESTVPPFELPASVSPFAARSRRVSTVVDNEDFGPSAAPSSPTSLGHAKRHTIGGLPSDLDLSGMKTPDRQPSSPVDSPVASPTRMSFSAANTPHRRSTTSILLRRASTAQRLLVDRGLLDIFSETCGQARSKAQLQQALFVTENPPMLPRSRMSISDASMLRRRRSFLESRAAASEITVSGDIRGTLLQTRTRRRMMPPPIVTRRRGNSVGSTTEVPLSGEDDTATSDRGTLVGAGRTRPFGLRASTSGSLQTSPLNSPISATPSIPFPRLEPKRSFHSLRTFNPASLNRRKTSSSSNLRPSLEIDKRAQSMPVTPLVKPLDPPHLDKSASDSSSLFSRTAMAPTPDRQNAWGSFSSLNLGSFGSLRRAARGKSTPALNNLAESIAPSVVSADDEGDADEEGEDEVQVTTKRRRSVRIFQSLSRFTPI